MILNQYRISWRRNIRSPYLDITAPTNRDIRDGYQDAREKDSRRRWTVLITRDLIQPGKDSLLRSCRGDRCAGCCRCKVVTPHTRASGES